MNERIDPVAEELQSIGQPVAIGVVGRSRRTDGQFLRVQQPVQIAIRIRMHQRGVADDLEPDDIAKHGGPVRAIEVPQPSRWDIVHVVLETFLERLAHAVGLAENPDRSHLLDFSRYHPAQQHVLRVRGHDRHRPQVCHGQSVRKCRPAQRIGRARHGDGDRASNAFRQSLPVSAQ